MEKVEKIKCEICRKMICCIVSGRTVFCDHCFCNPKECDCGDFILTMGRCDTCRCIVNNLGGA